MKRAYTFLSLLTIISAMRLPTFAQQPTPQSPIVPRRSFMVEALRDRLPPATETPGAPSEEPILRIQTVALRLPNPNAGLGQPGLWLTTFSGLYENALFQRQRFRETGHPIQFERGRLYFRQDLSVVTKGIILYRFWNDRLDLGLYKRSFHGEASPARAQALWFGQAGPLNRNYTPNDGRQIFFGVRFNLDKKSRQKH